MRSVMYLLRYGPTLTETFVYREAQELRRRGVEVDLVAMGARQDGVLQDLPIAATITPVPRGLRGAPLAAPAVLRLATRVPAEELKTRLRVAWLAHRIALRGHQRVHVHFAGEAARWGLMAARLAGVPCSVTVHAVDLFKPMDDLVEVLAGMDDVVTVSAFHRDWLWERHKIRSRVVRCGVVLPDDPPPPTYRASGDPLRVLCVARYVPKKGIDALVRAVEDASAPISLRLVSDAPRSLASGRVTVGLVPPSEIPRLLRDCDVFALPCRVADDGDRDGLPVALLEALAFARPVITTPVAGIPEVIDDAVGWVVPVDDAFALRQALDAARDHRARQARGARGPGRLIERAATLDAQVDSLLAGWAC